MFFQRNWTTTDDQQTLKGINSAGQMKGWFQIIVLYKKLLGEKRDKPIHVFTPRLTRRGITTEHVILPIAWQLCHEREGVCTNWTVSYPFPSPVIIQLTLQYAEERHKSSFHDFFLFLFVFLGVCHQTILQRCQNVYFWNSQNFTPCTSFFIIARILWVEHALKTNTD